MFQYSQKDGILETTSIPLQVWSNAILQHFVSVWRYETYFELYDTEYVHFLNSVHVVHCLCLVSLTRDVSDYAIW